jgi:hypothetical protein
MTSRYQQYYGCIGQHAKGLHGIHHSILVYGQEAVVPLEFLVPILRVAAITQMTE